MIEAGIQFTDQFLDQASLAGCSPSLDENKNGQFLFAQLFLHAHECGTEFLDFSIQHRLVLRFGFFKIFEHKVLLVSFVQYH